MTSRASGSIRRLAAAVATVFLIAVGGLAATGSPAQAAVWSCPNSPGVSGCFYPDANGGGTPYYTDFNQGCRNLPGNWNDRISSVRGSTNHTWTIRFWIHANCSGSSWSIRAGNQGNLANSGGTSYPFPNDGMTSWAIYPY